MKQLHEAIKEWMVKYKKNSVKLATYDRMLTSFDMMLNYTIAYVRLDVLCCDDIQEYINQLVKDEYALTTIKKQYNLITGFIKYANVLGLVERPIYNNVKLPTQSVVLKQKKEIIAYDEVEQIKLRKVFDTHSSVEYDVAMFMMETGVRIGEALALQWGDIDWRKKAVRINKTAIRLPNRRLQLVQNTAKSFSSNRIIPLSARAIELLKCLLEKEQDTDGLIFHKSGGQMLSYEGMRWHVRKACESAKVLYLGQHVFRHTFATNCYNRGCDVKILSKLLGHSDVSVTYNTYIHLYGDTLDEMRKVIG